MKVCRGNRGIGPLILNLGTGRGECSTSRLGRFTPGKHPGTHRTGGGGQKPAWKDLEEIKSLTPAGIRSPDLPTNKMIMSGFLWFNDTVICVDCSLTQML